jgi:hypothetical protein
MLPFFTLDPRDRFVTKEQKKILHADLHGRFFSPERKLLQKKLNMRSRAEPWRTNQVSPHVRECANPFPYLSTSGTLFV